MEGDNEEDWQQLWDSYWQGLARSSRVVSRDLSGEKPLGQADSHGMTWEGDFLEVQGIRDRVKCGSHPGSKG